MSGVELLRRVLVERLRIKVLYVSGYNDSGIINQGVLSTRNAFLQNPFTAITLHQKSARASVQAI
jgi:hypothetical protein